MHPIKKSYGPPRRPALKPYSTNLESIENFNNKLLSNEYLDSISGHLKLLESNSKINSSMIDLQPEIKWFMRPYLVNFTIQLHSSLKLKPQTLFLCWNIIDKYCSKRIVFKQHYQLISCTSLWIASKYEDKKSRVPTLNELNSFCSNIYDNSMFKEMEIHILSTLNWSIGNVNLEDILQLAVKFTDPDGKELLDKPLDLYKGNTPIVSAILAVSRYICELSLYEKIFLDYPISVVGITSFLMACSILNMDIGTNFINHIHEKYTNGKLNLDFFTFDTDVNIEGAENDHNNHDDDMQDIDFSKFGPFIQGFNGIDTICDIRILALNLFKLLLKPSDILIEKYSALGVITVIKRFINENDLFNVEMANDDLENPYNFELSNLLLSFNESCSFNNINNNSGNHHLLNDLRDFSTSTTSTTSTDSIFTTSNCHSPSTTSDSNFSSFSSLSSSTSTNFEFEKI